MVQMAFQMDSSKAKRPMAFLWEELLFYSITILKGVFEQ